MYFLALGNIELLPNIVAICQSTMSVGLDEVSLMSELRTRIFA